MTTLDESAISANATENTMTINLVYILYLVGFFTGITALIGVIMAYVCRGEAGDLGKAHFNYQIRIFWRGVVLLVGASILYVVASVIGVATFAGGGMAMGYGAAPVGLGAIGLGTVVMLLPVALTGYWFVWTIYRVVKGLVAVSKQRAI